jgi:glycosyltransferase involved in cell wall biosynthesis
MNVLELTSSIDPRGGGVIAGLTALAVERAAQGHKTTIASLDAPDAFDPSSLPFAWVGLGPGMGTYRYTSRLAPWLSAHAREFDAISIHGLWQWHSFGAWRVLSRQRVPYLVFTHGMLDPWFKRHYPLKHLKKCLYWPWTDYRVLRDATAVCFTCEQERTLAKQSFGLYRAHEQVTGLGITSPPEETPAQLHAFRRAVPGSTGKRMLLFMSRIHEKKGCDLLIRAFAQELAKYPEWHLVMAGPDQEGWTPSLQSLARECGIDRRISWPGMLTGDAKWGALRSAEAFCLPSHQENFGMVVAEALACGCPTLISDQVNIWQEITSSGAGFAEPDTLAGCASLLHRWQNLPAADASAMRAQAVTAFKSHFHIATATRKISALFAQMARSANIPAATRP